ncbi:MAG TPA: hypothetical protein VLZ74_07780 [Methylocella sp.]|nr:hypothetical protein [Methylocella sp.]
MAVGTTVAGIGIMAVGTAAGTMVGTAAAGTGAGMAAMATDMRTPMGSWPLRVALGPALLVTA